MSVFVSAAMEVEPTRMLLNAFWFTSAPGATPSSFFLSAALMRPATDCVAAAYVVSLAAMVSLSFAASGVRVTLVPATKVSVSVFVSAAMVVEPTRILPKAFWFTSAPTAMPSSLPLSPFAIRPSLEAVARE